MIESLSASSHSVAEALLLFLESLPEPIICYSAYHNCLECSGNLTASSQVISTLPASHKNVFNYLMAFLRELLKNSAKNHLDENILASIFGSLLLRNPAGHQKLDMAEKKKAQEFIHQFLCNAHWAYLLSYFTRGSQIPAPPVSAQEPPYKDVRPLGSKSGSCLFSEPRYPTPTMTITVLLWVVRTWGGRCRKNTTKKLTFSVQL